MAIETIIFLFGGLLLLAGLTGGGIQLRELNIPSIGGLPRIACLVLGPLFMALTFMIEIPAPPTLQPLISPPQNPNMIHFRIEDQLGENQISEQVTIIIDDREVGNITVSSDYPTAALQVTVPQEGRFSYHLRATAIFLENNENIEYSGVGNGFINVVKDKRFELKGGISGTIWQASLEEIQ